MKKRFIDFCVLVAIMLLPLPVQSNPQNGTDVSKYISASGFTKGNKQVGDSLILSRKFNPWMESAIVGTSSVYSLHRAPTTNNYGIITAPDEGVHKYYSRSGYSYYRSNGEILVGGQRGIVEIVEAPNDVVYIKDIISRTTQGTWVRGIKNGNTITVPAGQPVNYNTNYNLTESLNWGDYNTNGYFNKSIGDITFSIDETTKTISLIGSSEEHCIGYFIDEDGYISYVAEYETVWTLDENYKPASTDLVELPTGALVETWYAMGEGSTDIPTEVKVAIVDDKVYIAGLDADYPEAWFMGTLNGNTITFEGLQFVGAYGTYNIWVVGADVNTGNLLPQFTMTYDAQAKTLKLDADQYLVYNAADDRMYYLSLIEDLLIGKDVNTATNYKELKAAITKAEELLNDPLLTERGRYLLNTAISDASDALVTYNSDIMLAALNSLNEKLEYVKSQEVWESETIELSSSADITYDGTIIRLGTYAKILPTQGNGTSAPRSNSTNSYLQLYSGNTLTITSDKTIVAFSFSHGTNSPKGTVDTGIYNDNSWKGYANKIVFTSSGNCSLYSITLYYNNATNETLLARLNEQLAETEVAIQGLTYPNVYGRSELDALIEEAKSATVETEATILSQYTELIALKTNDLIALDNRYQALAALTDQVSDQNNPYMDAITFNIALDKVEEILQGLTDGIYSGSDIDKLEALLNNYCHLLSQVYLVINVQDEGSLGDLILGEVENFKDVYGLRVSGKLNDDDLYTLKNRMTGMYVLDMKGVSLMTIPNEQFSGNVRLKSVDLPNTLEKLGEKAFEGCTNLSEITIPSSLKTIGNRAFYNCEKITEVTLPEGLVSIGEYAFYCTSKGVYNYSRPANRGMSTGIVGGQIKALNLPSSLRSLGQYAFAYQTELQSLVIAEGLTSIGSNAFYYCQNLKEVSLPTTLGVINSEVFSKCTSLDSLTFPEGLKTIGYNAFSGCKGLKKVFLPSTLSSIYNSFLDCDSLKEMTCRAIVPPNTNENNILGGLESSCKLTVPNLSIKEYKQTVYWDRFKISGEDYLPEQINITSDFRLSWPDDMPDEYKPAIVVYEKAALSVSGNSTLSSSYFRFYWDSDYARDNTYSDLWGNTTHVRDNYYSVLMSNGNIRSDVVSVTLYDRVNEWDFLSFPFDVKVGDLRSLYNTTPLAIRKYDGQKRAEGLMNETWVRMTSDSILHAGQGYIWQTAPTEQGRTYNGIFVNAMQTVNKNNIFTNADVEVALNYYESEFPHNRSWNLIGNPYPAYYDIRAMQTSSPVTVWDTYSKNYRAYSPLDDAYILNPGQAFFVQRPVNEESITFLKEGRQIDMTVRSIDYTNRAASTAERSVFNVVISGGEMNDRTRFVINNAAEMDYEEGRDASKFMSDDQQTIEIYTMQDDILYSINERPFANGIVEIGVRAGVDAMYTIILDTNFDNEVYLIDRETGTETRIDGTEGYSFYANKGSIEGRFAIRLGGGVVTGIKNVASEGDEKLDTMYDVQGRRIVQPRKGLFINNGKKVVVK